jgi:hypothetical protein
MSITSGRRVVLWLYEENRSMGTVTHGGVINAARKLQGSPVRTAGGQTSFDVQVVLEQGRDVIVVTPQSTKTPRILRADVGDVIDRFNSSGSMRPSDYMDITRNASYILALIAKV